MCLKGSQCAISACLRCCSDARLAVSQRQLYSKMSEFAARTGRTPMAVDSGGVHVAGTCKSLCQASTRCRSSGWRGMLVHGLTGQSATVMTIQATLNHFVTCAFDGFRSIR